MVAGIAAPVARKRLKRTRARIVCQAVAFAGPLGLSVATRRSSARDLGVCGLQMWAYVAAYKSAHDDPRAQLERTQFDYPIVLDRALGFGELPTIRLQRALAREGDDGPEWRALDHALVWTHWSWFMVPHVALLYILVRRPERFARAAVLTYAVFDIGATLHWISPTAPPWYAEDAPYGAKGPPPGARNGIEVRRVMVEYGEMFWQDGWGRLYSVFGGNPLAAIPSLHFATSLMAAILLAEAGPIAGALGATYAITLAFALVYLGEHYVVDLLAGAALTIAVRRAEPAAAGAVARAGRAVAALEALAHEGI